MNVGGRGHTVRISRICRFEKARGNFRVCLLSLVLAASGCFTSSLNHGSSSSTGTQSVLPTFNNTTSGLTITNVLLDSASPNDTFDILGDGSGTIGTLCTSTSGTVSNTGPTTCNCAYSFITAGGTSESFEVPTLYNEADLLRCTYAGVPTTSYVQVSIHITNSDGFSNQFKFSFSSTISVLDPSNPNSFAVVQRYQCKDVVSVPYLFQGDTTVIYDPLQSENPNLSYPRNFYTTNLGGSFSEYASQTLTPAWNCPTIPNDPNAGLDLTVYSVGPDSSGSEKIYPPLGSAFDRSTFYVAAQPAGVFTIPIDSMIVPVLASGAANGLPPTGYGASPLPAGTGAETCPDATVVIPSGYHWVKVWLFRADLAPRQFQISAAINLAQSITCNPGNFPAPSGAPVYPNCNPNDVAGGVVTPNPASVPPTLASRVLGVLGGNSQFLCEDINSVEAPCAPGQGPGCGSLAISGQSIPGADEWREIFAVNPTNPASVDPFHVFTNSTVGVGPAPAGPGYVIPTDTTFTLGNLDAAGQARYDFLFVVTPTSVMSAQMENSALSANYPYTPFRFRSPADCQSGNPNNPAFAGDCSSTNVIHYGLKLHDVGTNGDPSGSSTDRTGVFPVCALQPN